MRVKLSRRHFLQAGSGAALLSSLPASPSPGLDRFGGWRACPLAPPAHDFRLHRAADRWLFVTPAGHAFWMLGVFDVNLSTSEYLPGRSYRNNILKKYSAETAWGRQMARRLRAWGFNVLAEYSSSYCLPLALYGRPANPTALPFMAMIRPSFFSLSNRWGLASGAVKNIVAATDPAVYTGWRRAALPDVYDPQFAAYALAEALRLSGHLGVSDFQLGITTDDAEDLFGFGPGPAIPAARIHPHIGWLVLAANPLIAADPAQGMQYSDPRLHSKYALRDWLRRRYGTLARLNRAWGSRYASFDHAGGWPHGRGLLDESGRNPWFGADYKRLATATPALRADLDRFLFYFARQYFQSVCGACRRAFPGKLLFGPATLNAWNGLTRAPILRAAGQYVDVLQANADSAELLNATLAAAGERPLVTWTGMAANADSDLANFMPPPGTPLYTTQAARGAAYLHSLRRASALTSASGLRPIAGTKFWALVDSWPEKTNWGLVTFLDNAYDGREAVRPAGRDSWGYPTGGEARDYGNSLSAIQRANRDLASRLQAELSAACRV